MPEENQKEERSIFAAIGVSKADGHEPQIGIMILAFTIRHRMGRPATGMGGGTDDPMERQLLSRRLYCLRENVKRMNPRRSSARILSNDGEPYGEVNS